MVIVEGKFEGSIDVNTIKPALTLRPHHIPMYHVSRAIQKLDTPERVAKAVVEGQIRESPKWNKAYVQDIYQGVSESDKAYVIDNLTKGFSLIQSLPDETYVHLDISPDIICNSFCGSRRHCRATNYRGNFAPCYIPGSEAIYLGRIRRDLERAGYILGRDFFEKQTTHTLEDLGGNMLDHSEKGPEKVVLFNSLIVRTSALRDPRIKGLKEEEKKAS